MQHMISRHTFIGSEDMFEGRSSDTAHSWEAHISWILKYGNVRRVAGMRIGVKHVQYGNVDVTYIWWSS